MAEISKTARPEKRNPESRIGEKYGKWTILSIIRGDPKVLKTLARCDCGTEKISQLGNIIRGLSLSCGCFQRSKETLNSNTMYRAWADMKKRCSNPHFTHSDRYLLRGITVCAGWIKFDDFCKDMIDGYLPGLTIERINNNYGYWCGRCQDCVSNERISNCKWDTMINQASNKENNRVIEYNGSKFTLSQLSRKFNMTPQRLARRLDAGWSVEKALHQSLRVGDFRKNIYR